jgi:hypothetical protein
MMKHSFVSTMENHPCKPACSLTEYKGSTKDSTGTRNEFILDIVLTLTSVTKHEEYLIYDIYTFVGSVGGYIPTGNLITTRSFDL